MDTKYLCHGKRDRCFNLRGYQFPLCSRCTGIYTGFVFSLLWELLLGVPPKNLIPLWILVIIPTAVDGITQLLRERTSSNPIRFLTGFPAGVGIMFLIRTLRRLII
jgi:uncharacterized membrane protein